MPGLRRVATVLLLASVAGAACRVTGRAADPAQTITTYTAALRIEADGTLDVREDFVLAAPAPGDRFVRRIPVDLFDRVDGVIFQREGNPPQPLASSDPDGGLDVSIPLRDSRAGEHLELQYRVAGAVAVRGGRGLLTWTMLPPGHPFAIDAASVALVLPDSIATADGAPAPPPGWTVKPAARGWLFEAGRIPARTPATITASLAVDPAAVLEADWQAAETRTRQLMPAFVSAALCILATGTGIVFMMRWQFGSRAGSRTPAELDRAGAARGMVVTGWVLIVLGLVAAAATWRWFTYFGAWPVVVPLSVTIVGVAFLPEARRLRVDAPRD
jgi:hypothetical protein